MGSPGDPELPDAVAILRAAGLATVIGPTDRDYALTRSTYTHVGEPVAVVRASTTTEVANTLGVVREHSLALAVRSGGHGLGGLSTNSGGVVLDLSEFREIEIVDEATRQVRVGVGATWAQVANVLAPRGWSVSSGNNGDVGVGGIATQGGIGFLVRAYGLTLDHVRRVELVTTAGVVLVVDDDHHRDLFWAVRGGGPAVGVVTRVELEADEGAEVVHTEAVLDVTDTAAAAERWAAAIRTAPRELTSFINIQPARHGRPALARVELVWAGTDADAAAAACATVLEAAPVIHRHSAHTPYPALMPVSGAPHLGQQRLQFRNGFLARMTSTDAAAVAELLDSPAVVLIELRSIDGAMHDVPIEATAFAHRSAEVFVAVWAHPARTTELDRAWGVFARRLVGSYGAYSSDTGPQSRAQSFPGETGARLAALARRYDPDGVLASSSLVPAVGAVALPAPTAPA